MDAPVSYGFDGSIATLGLDDGKVNALSLTMFAAINDALDRAAADGAAALVVHGRDGVFSAGFDLAVLRGGGADAVAMLRAGWDTAERLLLFPRPVVAAATGHAIAMGLFLLLASDVRVGTAGPFRLTANEVAIGLPVPGTALEICRLQLAATHFHRVVALAEVLGPDEAVAAGVLHRLAPAGGAVEAATAMATELAALDLDAHADTKRRARAGFLAAYREALAADFDR